MFRNNPVAAAAAAIYIYVSARARRISLYVTTATGGNGGGGGGGGISGCSDPIAVQSAVQVAGLAHACVRAAGDQCGRGDATSWSRWPAEAIRSRGPAWTRNSHNTSGHVRARAITWATATS